MRIIFENLSVLDFPWAAGVALKAFARSRAKNLTPGVMRGEMEARTNKAASRRRIHSLVMLFESPTNTENATLRNRNHC